jgi:histone H1/5
MSTDKKQHPTYEIMICDAIVHLAERKGSSSVAIFKFIKDKYNLVGETLKAHLKLALKRLSDNKKLVKVSRNLYKLSVDEKKSLRSTKAGSKSKVALKKKVRKVTPRKLESTMTEVKKEATPTKVKTEKKTKSVKKAVASPKKEKVSKVKKTDAAKVKKVDAKSKKSLKSKSIDDSKAKSKASAKARAERAINKGKSASTAIKSSRRRSTPAVTTEA